MTPARRQKKAARTLCTAPGCPSGPRYRKRRERARSPESLALRAKIAEAYAGHVDRHGRPASKAIEQVINGGQHPAEMMDRRADEGIAADVADEQILRPVLEFLAHLEAKLRRRRRNARRVA